MRGDFFLLSPKLKVTRPLYDSKHWLISSLIVFHAFSIQLVIIAKNCFNSHLKVDQL